ncbi:hypothetical protein ISP15_07380 [Dyella jejuensis]|uniref:Uncharacterized protein n=1 Tax=Dyella jejuensis TaxID=1432009 RepID=A0ABW8JGC7_9GAMM
MDHVAHDVLAIESPDDVRRVSFAPQEGYVLDPWSGLYREMETTYRQRRCMEAVSA